MFTAQLSVSAVLLNAHFYSFLKYFLQSFYTVISIWIYIITRCDPIEMYVIMVCLLQTHMPQLSPLCYLSGSIQLLSWHAGKGVQAALCSGRYPLHPCMSFIILSSVSLSKCYFCVCCPPVALFGSALWQHLPGLNRPGVFLAKWHRGANLRAGVGGCVSSCGPGEFTLAGNLGGSSDYCQATSSSVLHQAGMACHLERQREAISSLTDPSCFNPKYSSLNSFQG